MGSKSKIRRGGTRRGGKNKLFEPPVEKLCKNCVHWTKNEDTSNHGECNCDKFVYGGRRITAPDDGLEYADFEGYDAFFTTGALFGCIHFKPRT